MPTQPQTPADVFPSATADGKQIRYDVARPLRVAELQLAVGTNTAYDIANTENILCVYAPVRAAIVFDVDTLVLRGDVAGLVVAPEERAMFSVPEGTKQLFCRALGTAGSIYIHEFGAWHGLSTRLATQIG